MHGGQIFRLPLGISWQHWIHTPKPVLLWLRLNRGWSSFLVLYLSHFFWTTLFRYFHWIILCSHYYHWKTGQSTHTCWLSLHYYITGTLCHVAIACQVSWHIATKVRSGLTQCSQKTKCLVDILTDHILTQRLTSLIKLWKEAWKGAVHECSAIPRVGQKQAKTTSFTPSRSRPCWFLLHQRVITVSTCPVKLNQKGSDPLFWNISNQFRQKKTLKSHSTLFELHLCFW